MNSRILLFMLALSTPLLLAAAKPNEGRWTPEEISAYIIWTQDGCPGIPEGESLSFQRQEVYGSHLLLAKKYKAKKIKANKRFEERWKKEFDSLGQ